jgi:hypothetical protein
VIAKARARREHRLAHELIDAPSPYFRIVTILDRNGSALGETAGPEAVQ